MSKSSLHLALQFSIRLIKWDAVLDRAVTIQEANLAIAKARTALCVGDRLLLVKNTGSTPGASYTCQPFLKGLISMIVM